MSHEATNWALAQRDLKPATKAVLFCLANRHNPARGCFPSHQRIASDAGMSERSVRNHLAQLEAKGLIRRVRGTGGRLKRAATRYVFAFEDGSAQVEQSTERVESRRQKTPTSRRQILPSNPVREPQLEEDARGAPDSFDLFEGVKRAVGLGPKAILPSWWRERAALAHVLAWKDRFGLTDAEILEVAAHSRKVHPIPPDGPKALDRAMERRWRANLAQSAPRRSRRYKRQSAAPAATVFSEQDGLKLKAEWVNGDRFLPMTAFTNGDVQSLLREGLVTPARLRQRGLGHLIPNFPWASRREVAQ